MLHYFCPQVFWDLTSDIAYQDNSAPLHICEDEVLGKGGFGFVCKGELKLTAGNVRERGGGGKGGGREAEEEMEREEGRRRGGGKDVDMEGGKEWKKEGMGYRDAAYCVDVGMGVA